VLLPFLLAYSALYQPLAVHPYPELHLHLAFAGNLLGARHVPAGSLTTSQKVGPFELWGQHREQGEGEGRNNTETMMHFLVFILFQYSALFNQFFTFLYGNELRRVEKVGRTQNRETKQGGRISIGKR
jgi:hypothetical protein